MAIVRYCYVMDCFVGVMTFEDNGEIRMDWQGDSELSDLARKFKKYIPLSSTKLIELFISERCIDENRPDRSLWLSMIGLGVNASDREIFLANHGVSINDLFWIDSVKSSAYWDNYYKYIL